MREFILQLQQFVDTLPMPLQIGAVAFVGLVPFLEGDVAATIGVVAGIHWLPAITVGAIATIGISMVALSAGEKLGARHEDRWQEHRVMQRVEQWGVPIGMLISGFIASVPVTAFVMRASGIRQAKILPWAIAVATLNAIVAGLIAAGILQWLFDL